MLLKNNSANDIVTSGVIATQQYGMTMNAKAFRILSNTLYQDKTGSIVREICSNAMDSHTAAGNPELPFDIHLPTAFEPWWSVKDYGVGLSREGVLKTFTTLFHSTKDNSNDQVGAFGLGCKSIWSYVDTFTLNSVFDGVLSTYSAILSEDGIPTMNLMAEEPTDDHNGVEIIIPVESKDFSKYRNDIASQLAFFKVKPIITNDANFTFRNHETNILFPLNCNVSIRDEHKGYGCGATFIVQGGVGYPLNTDLIEPKIKNNNIKTFFNQVVKRGANYYFNIGEIEVTPSREAISYSESTINNIINKITSAYDEMSATILATVDTLPNNWKRAKYLNNAGDLAKSLVPDNNKYGLTLYSGRYQFSLNGAAIRDVTITKEDGTVTTDRVYKFDIHTYQIKQTVSGKNVSASKVFDVVPNDKTVILLTDDSKGKMSRIRHYVRESDVTVHLYTPRNAINVVDEINTISAALGGVDVIRVSSLPMPVRAYNKTARDGYTTPKLWLLEKSSFTNNIRDWTPLYDKVADIEDGGYYLVYNDRNIQDGQVNNSYFNLLNRAELIDMPVYCIREKDVAKIKDNADWIHLSVMINEKIVAMTAQYKPKINRVAVHHAMSQKTNAFNTKVFDCLLKNKDKINDVRLRKLINHINKAKNISEYIKNIPEHIKTLLESAYNAEITEISQKCKNHFSKITTELQSKYMLLEHLNLYYSYGADLETEANHILVYVNAIAA